MARKPPKPTPEKILSAALQEFARSGYSGARVDRIGNRAGVNKQLIYYYFKNKSGLYREVFRRVRQDLQAAVADQPENLADNFLYWMDYHYRNPDNLKLLEWEEKAGPRTGRKMDKADTAFWREILDNQKQRYAENLGLDPPQALITWFAIVAFPLAFPHLCRTIANCDIKDPQFQEKRKAFLSQLAGILEDATRKKWDHPLSGAPLEV
ncbi:MAG: TetR/AcrR family transcriptional regulator [Opitutales bacterium]